MTDRIIINKDGIKASRPGFDANTSPNRYLLLHPNMSPMRPIYKGEVYFSGVGAVNVSIPNPSSSIPYCILKSNTGQAAGRNTFCIEMFSPFNVARVRNIDGIARTVNFVVLL